nr:hypothetical protein [uncultured Roseibium sp.]
MDKKFSKQFEKSSRREEYAEYVFLGSLVQEAWKRDVDLTILRSQTDADGYDVVLETDEVTRHIQLKTSGKDAQTKRQKLSLKLSRRPSGCVVWIILDPETLEVSHFLWYGGMPGQPLPDLGTKIAKHNKANAQGVKAERPNHRELPRSQFTKLQTVAALFDVLFGD